MPKSRSAVKSKENIWKCIFALRNSLRLDRYIFSRHASAKLHDSRTSRITLLKGWSLCTPRLEQHRLSSGKNPRKSFLPFPVSAERRRHFPRGMNLSFFRFSSYSSSLIYFAPFSHSSFRSFCSLISLLQVRGLKPMEKLGSFKK